MSHALESLTARAWPRRLNPARGASRPVSQGANPFSDGLASEALRAVGKFLVRAVSDAADIEARTEMMYAAMQAGIAFNAAGCHLPHGLSYAVSGTRARFPCARLPGRQDAGPARHGGRAQQSVGLAIHGAVVPGAPSARRDLPGRRTRGARARPTRAKRWPAAWSS